MNGMTVTSLWCTDSTKTLTIDFAPAFTLAYISLSKVSSDGTARAGITSFRHRLDTGADATVVLSAPGQGLTPTKFSHAKVTSVTFEIWTFDCFGYATAVLTFW